MSGRPVTSVIGHVLPRVQTPLQGQMGLAGGASGKESAANAGEVGSIPGSGRSPGGGHGSPRQYS